MLQMHFAREINAEGGATTWVDRAAPVSAREQVPEDGISPFSKDFVTDQTVVVDGGPAMH